MTIDELIYSLNEYKKSMSDCGNTEIYIDDPKFGIIPFSTEFMSWNYLKYLNNKDVLLIDTKLG